MKSSIENADSKKWQLGVLRNIEGIIPKAYRKRTFNWVIVKDYLLQHTSKGGRTSACRHCEFLGVDPDGFTFWETEEQPQLYYIQNRGYLGNALLWWSEGRNGYTCDISCALKVTAADALSICEREEDTAWPVDYIDSLTVSHKKIVDCQYVDNTKMIKSFTDGK